MYTYVCVYACACTCAPVNASACMHMYVIIIMCMHVSAHVGGMCAACIVRHIIQITQHVLLGWSTYFFFV